MNKTEKYTIRGIMKYSDEKRDDETSINKHSEQISYIKNNDVSVAFLGDSITRRWEEHPEQWKVFKEFSPVNLGVGADRIENLNWRLNNGILNNIQPKVALLLIGTNNLPTDKPNDIGEGICGQIDLIKKNWKETVLLVCPIFPRYPDEVKKDYLSDISTVNSIIKNKCNGNDIIYMDLCRDINLVNGLLPKKLTDDGLHLNEEGYKAIQPVIIDYLKQYLN